MKDLQEDFGEMFGAILKAQLEEISAATDLAGKKTDLEEKREALKQRIMAGELWLLPYALETILGIGNTAAYEIMKRPDFPPPRYLGGKRYGMKDEMLEFLRKNKGKPKKKAKADED